MRFNHERVYAVDAPARWYDTTVTTELLIRRGRLRGGGYAIRMVQQESADFQQHYLFALTTGRTNPGHHRRRPCADSPASHRELAGVQTPERR